MSFLEDFDHLKIEMKDILLATDYFNSNRMIGSGGFGRVYKGELSHPGGRINKVAIKKLDRRLGQGNSEFQKEVMILSKYKHENLISFLGYCKEGGETILVYEHASRGSLDRYLSDASLTWIQRLKICVGVARGLQYLHDPRGTQQRVIHRDIKSNDILLDEHWNAKVSDFGLAKLGQGRQGQTSLASIFFGMPGYCDPLYLETDILSKESDVYSFGVVLLEILCGRLCCEYNKGKVTNVFVHKWKQCYIENTLDKMIFPGLTEQIDPGSLNAFSAIAYQCLEKDRDHRPTMAEVVEKLEFALQQQRMSKEVDWEVELPDSPLCKNLLKLCLQVSHLSEIPAALFEHMPLLKELDLSTTSIQSLPSSISSLILLQKLFLRDCRVSMELPSEIGMLTKLKLLDCEGSGIMYIPKEIGELNDLEVLKVSLSLYADNFLKTKRVNGSVKIPKNILSKLNKLKELCLTTRPEVESWEEDIKEIQDDLCLLQHLKTLKWYLPSKMVLHQFLQIKREGKRIYENLSNFTLTIGRDPQLTSCLPANLEKKFEKFENCLKWINAEGEEKDISMIMEHAEALFLSRHWTIVRLSVFNLTKLKYCLLSECNEMETLAEVRELSQEVENIGKVGLESIEYLTVYDMEKFQTIWKGPMGKDSLSRLRILALHRCLKLTTIFTINIAQSLSRLTELIVEDCPNVRSLISDESSNIAIGPLIPCLEKIYLLDLPELDAISRGKIILEKVETLFVYSCSKLKYLSVTELPNIQKIKGEKEWWNDLICDKTRLQNVFEQLEEEAINLFDQLAEATNSLQHFDHIMTRDAKVQKPLDHSRLGMSETKGHTSNFHIEEQGLSLSQPDAKDDKPLDRSSLVVSGTKDHTSNLSMERSSPFLVGLGFCPTDIELVMYYLKRKLLGRKDRLDAVAEVNIYDFSPWDLPGKSSLRSGNLWFFFVPKVKKYSSGKRETKTGYWKVTGKHRVVKYEERIVAMIKTWVFYQWKAGVAGERTNWVMHEYKMEDEQLANAGITQDMYVLCKVFKKIGFGPKNDSQYGAPFCEEDWNDDIKPASKFMQREPHERASMSEMLSQIESETLGYETDINPSTSIVEDDFLQHFNAVSNQTLSNSTLESVFDNEDASKDHGVSAESEAETSIDLEDSGVWSSMGISMAEYLGTAKNIFGEPIRNRTMLENGLNPTRENKAQVAYKMMNQGNKYDNALRFVKDLKAQWGTGISALCLLYNATGETLTYTTSHNWFGDIGPSPYPTIILNGQWGVYLHTKTPRVPSGSVAAVVYRGKYSEDAFCDYMITWSIPWQRFTDNAAYCEINQVGQSDVVAWDAIYHKTLLAGRESSTEWKDCYTRVKIENDPSPIFKAILTHINVEVTSV